MRALGALGGGITIVASSLATRARTRPARTRSNGLEYLRSQRMNTCGRRKR